MTMLLADAAQEVNGKLYVLGGGWSVTGPDLPPMSLAIKLDVPWSAANQPHRFELVLVDTDGRPVTVDGGQGVRVEGTFEVGRPPGTPAGSDIDFAFAVNVPPFPIGAGRYAWQLSIDGETAEDWLTVPGPPQGMTVALGQVIDVLDSLYDPRGAAVWDVVGLVTGDPEQPVGRVVFAVDPVQEVIDEAVEWQADLLVTHHPLLLRPVH
ncbi:MAG: Nif3-like dinuclear metal center hexameric protein, partial [Actinomycetes bacterium]